MPKVIYSNGLSKEVKNLGWLVAHFSEVVSITVTEPSDISRKDDWGALLIVKMAEKKEYRCLFGSTDVLWNWLMNKQWLQGVPLNWFGEKMFVLRSNKKGEFLKNGR